jgi:vacuolar protein sorting-associated protein IST1
MQLRQMRRDIAKLLEAGQEATARIRVRISPEDFFLFRVPGSWIWGWGLTSDGLTCVQVEHIIREENMMAAQEILELFCELVSVRLPIIETQKFVAIPVLFF